MAWCEQAVGAAVGEVGPDALPVARALNLLGVACKFAGRFDQAETAYRRARAIAERDAPESGLMAALLHNLGGLEHSRGRHEEGVRFARRGLALRERLTSPDDPSVALDRAALAALLEGMGQEAEAERLYRRALDVLDATAEWPLEVAMARNGLGSACQAQERFDEAERHYRRALEQLEAVAGPDHPNVGHVLNNLATLHRRRGEDAEARALLARAHDLLVGTLGADHPVTREVEGNRRRVEASPSPYVAR